jgi:hypothetical protein
MRIAELFMALPWLYLLFGLRAFLPLSVSPLTAFFLIVTVIGAVGWARPARLVRGVVLSAKERDLSARHGLRNNPCIRGGVTSCRRHQCALDAGSDSHSTIRVGRDDSFVFLG